MKFAARGLLQTGSCWPIMRLWPIRRPALAVDTVLGVKRKMCFANLDESATVLTEVKDRALTARGPAALLDLRLRASAWRCQIGTAE